jgi:cardiolipin synthase
MSPAPSPPHRPPPQRAWVPGNRIELLENGEEFFPAVFEAIAQARREVIIETFILFEDKVGLALKEVLVAAGRRGVHIDLLVDGYGSCDLSDGFIAELAAAGVRLRAFDPRPRLFGLFRTNLLRRMHRKIVVVDGELAFVGGINYSADHLGDFGPQAKQDYAVRVRGPIVAAIHAFARSQMQPYGRRHGNPPVPVPPPAGDAHAMFVIRDNLQHMRDIERQYRAAIRAARREVIIANAYFFPGYRLLKTIRQAARRGVRVRLILQGEPDMPVAKAFATTLHGHLLRAGVEIHEYCRRPLHGKVAVVDDRWATVGSSNLDPWSLSLNLEANVITRDPAFVAELRERLERLVCEHCSQIDPSSVGPGWRWALLDTFAYHATRWFPVCARWLPAHRPRLQPLQPAGGLPPAGRNAPASTTRSMAASPARAEVAPLACEGGRDAQAGAAH